MAGDKDRYVSYITSTVQAYLASDTAVAHRENFLGHSINAPVGRWQKNKVRLGCDTHK